MPNEGKTLDKWLVEQADDTPIDIVYGGAYSIKDYYMESGNPRQMRGASQLLLDAAEEFEKYCYFACGAESFLIVPRGQGEVIATKLEDTFREKTLTAQAAAVWHKTTVGTLLDADAFGKLWKKLNRKFKERRMLLFQPMELPADTFQYFINTFGHFKPYIKWYKDGRLCSRCNYRKAAYVAQLEYEGEFLLCPSCAYKEARGSYLLRTGYRWECMHFNKSIIWREEEEAEDDLFWPHGAQDLGDHNGDIALLYGDINNLGGAGQCLGGNAEQRKRFCEAVDKTVKEALYAAISKAVVISQKDDLKRGERPRAKFEIIARGGDDTCVLLPGEVALLAGTLLLEEFDSLWAETGFSALTISAGIAIGQANTPILYMREAAEQLLKLAKGKAHHENCSCLDILSLNSDGQWATNIEKKLREDLKKTEGGTRAIRTMRPFTVSEARTFLACLQKHEVSKSTLHNIAEASDRCGIAEGDLWFRYLQSRHGDKAFDSLAMAYKCAMYYDVAGRKDGITKISPWRDLAELQGQKGGEEI